MSGRDLLHLMGYVARRRDGDLSLATLARRSRRSRFQLHREFVHVSGETPKEYVLRLRLERAAGRLVADRTSVLAIALDCGFASHEVFTRAFRRRYGCTPLRYRTVALAGAPAWVRERHAALVDAVGPCIRLFRTTNSHPREKKSMPMLSITRMERPMAHALIVRRRIGRSEIAATLGDCYGKIFLHGQKVGAAFQGRPFARYPEFGTGLITIEAGFPIAAPVAGDGEVQASTMPGGALVVGVHAGAYENLHETYTAIERWIEANGLKSNGAPWESYTTDPADLPDTKDWRTEVCWPVK
jgi:AraC family transcriptional regulator